MNRKVQIIITVGVITIFALLLYFANRTNLQKFVPYYPETVNASTLKKEYAFSLDCKDNSNSQFEVISREFNDHKSYDVFSVTGDQIKYIGQLQNLLNVDWVTILPIRLVSADDTMLFYITHINESAGKYSAGFNKIVPNIGLKSPYSGPDWMFYEREGLLQNNFAVIPIKKVQWTMIESVRLQTKDSLEYGSKNSSVTSSSDNWYYKIDHFSPVIDLENNVVEIYSPNCSLL